MASSLLNDDEDNATRNAQQQQQQNQQKTSNLNASSSNSAASKMQDNEAKLKKQNLEQRKQELEQLLNEKSWLLQQLQKQETQILNGNIEFLNFNDFISNLALQYKQEQKTDNNSNAHNAGDDVSTVVSGGGVGSNNLTSAEEAILRRKPLTAKENYQNLNNNNNNVLHRRQSEVSNRSSEYDNYPQNDNQSTHSEGGRCGAVQGANQTTQQYNAKAALKKRSATVAGTTAQSSSNLQIIRQQHLEQQQQHLLFKQQQQQYIHPQQQFFKQHIEQHQVLMPHLQYATQKFYYTTLQPQTIHLSNQQQQLPLQQQQQQQQTQYARYTQNKQIAQQQTLHHNQNLNAHKQAQQQQQPILLTPTAGMSGGLNVDNISLYSLNSNNVATLHRPAQQQQPIIVQCDKYYLSPTSHHVSHTEGGGFIKSSQNIKEYVSPQNSPLHLNARDKIRSQTSQASAAQRGVTPALDIISLAPSYMSMETIDYSTSPVASNMRWRSQTYLPPLQNAGVSADIKSQSSDMLNNNQYYNTALNPPPPPTTSTSYLLTQNHNLLPPPNVTQVKPFKPLDDVSLTSYSTETQKKLKPKQWLESSLDGPVIRQTPVHEEPTCSSTSFSAGSNSNQNRAKLSSQSLNTARHYSMSSAQTKSQHNQVSSAQANPSKLSQSTSYLNQMDFVNANQANTPTPSISQPYNLELSPQTSTAYKYLAAQQKGQPVRSIPSALYVNTSSSNLAHSATPTPPLAAALSPDIRIESPVNMTIVQPATFQPYKEVTKPFEMSDFYKYSTKFRQKENNNNNNITSSNNNNNND